MRYITQRDEYSCGAIALANAMKWAGERISWKESANSIRKMCRTNTEHGTWFRDLDRVIKRYFKNVEFRWNLSLEEMDDHLRSGGAVVYNYTMRDDEEMGHYIFIDGISDSGKSYYVVNACFESKGECYPRRRFTRGAFRKHFGRQPDGWLLRR